MVPALPDRSPAVVAARAAVSPSAVVLAGGGVAIGLLAGLPVVATVVLGAGLWGIRVAAGSALAARRRRRANQPEPIDPFAVPDPWRRFVREALTAQNKFGQTVSRCPPGPLRDRLGEVAGRVDDGVRESWRVATLGAAVDAALASLDLDGTSKELRRTQELRQHPAGPTSPSADAVDQTEAALAARLQSTRRIQASAQQATDRLRVLTAQLNEAVASAVELSLATTDPGSVDPLAGQVESAVSEIEALRQGMEEVDQAIPRTDIR
jgi:hypothetical protein